ncbi:BlaI/MecI/CopY family transcriptional regulator [Rubritalea tangerina]|uniref:BlaI/MecI/CopY family transcriptional regulator n=1 Tax=Rubritalea tangerina TaxID=430798 RepID=A0ABW4Z8F0_9BACT
MNRLEKGQLSRRERQIMDIIYRLGKASAKEVQDNLPDPPSYSAVRALLATLESKGMVTHGKESRRYIYQAAINEKKARKSAIQNLLATFFEGKPQNLVAALLNEDDDSLSKDEIAEIRKLVEDKNQPAN